VLVEENGQGRSRLDGISLDHADGEFQANQ
jgi:hypothetical protein